LDSRAIAAILKFCFADSDEVRARSAEVLLASVDLHDGDEESALENLRKAKDIDPIEFKELLPYAVTIQKYINA
jgi:hypothetical protein